MLLRLLKWYNDTVDVQAVTKQEPVMIRKILGRLAAVRPLAFAFFALASFAASAFDTPYLTFRSAASFSLRVSSPKWDGKIEYSTDTVNWTEWNGASVSAALSDGQYRLYLRGENNTNLNGGSYSGWSLTGSNIYCDGDIEALRGYSGNPPAMEANCCKYMFSGQSALVSAPSLSATTLNSDCYEYMFRGCTGLKSLPELPATALASYCYYQMFDGCTSLEIYDSAPDATWNSVAWSIPAGATGGGYSWASGMFGGTGGTFTGAPTAGTTYYVASALPPGQMYQAVNSGTLTPVFTGSAANWDLSATIKNGVGNLTFTYANGTLPPGVAPSGSSLVGTPTATGTYNFTLSVTDADNNVFNSATYSVVIMAPMANVSTPYIDASGAPQTHDCLELNANVAIWDQAWYVVAGNLNFGTGGITVDGNVNLVLADGASMSVVGGPSKAGVNVPYGSSLTIYGQSGGTGTLTASGNPDDEWGSGGAGIGGNTANWETSYENCGTITINGGRVIASSGNENAAGIGGGYYGNGGLITINGGIVTATANHEYEWGTANGAGIGGGYSGGGGTVVINGGNVTAIAEGVPDEFDEEYASVGIGKGNSGYGGTLTVADNVTVNAGPSSDALEVLPHGAGGAITVTSQRYFVIETEGSLPLAQKSGTTTYTAYTDEVFNLSLASTISGGTQPYAFALASGTLPAGLQFANGYTTITGTPTTSDVEEQTITMTVTDGADGNITATYTIKATTRTKTITYMDGETVLNYNPTNYTPGSSLNIYLPSSPTVSKEGYTFVGWYRNPEFTGGSLAWFSSSAETTNLTFYAKFSKNAPVSYSLYYYDYEEATGQTQLYLQPSSYTVEDLPLDLPEPAKDGYTFVGWGESYASEVTITTLPVGTTGYKALYAKWTENTPEPPEPEPGEGDIEVSFVDENGDPMQQLCTVVTAETATFTNGGWYVVNANVSRKTISVEGSANLVLKDGWTLTITADNWNPGIKVTTGNAIAIYGQANGTGAVIANGGSAGAGIGGYYDEVTYECGTIVINGGTITANGTNAAGIGGGTYGNGGTVTINRGTVNANGGNNSAGIGGGTFGSNGGTVTINGGTVNAEGGASSAGIGGGAKCNGAVVTINGGTVRADGGISSWAGIGSGRIWGTDEFTDGSLWVASKMVVKASTNLFETAYTDEHIREVNETTHLLVVDPEWHSFLIEESVAPMPTVSQIHYYDGYTPVELEPSSYEEGTATPLATPAKNGFTFEGWCDNNALSGDAIKTLPASATGDQTFYAKWTPIVYSITYYLKGVPVELEPSTYTATNALTMLPEYPNGYYVSWYTNDQFTGEKQLAISYGSYGNKEFWAKISSAIGYKAEFYDGGTLLRTPSTIFFDAESDTIVLPRTAYKDGYRFIDWYDNVGLDGDPVTTIPAGSISNKQFYAKWEATTDPVFTVDSEGTLIHFALNSATEITIPNNVYNIDSLLCYGGDYSAMTSLVIPGTVTNIGDSAFSSCTGLTNLTIEAGVKTIGDSAFFGCTALTCGEDGLYIPDSVTSIGNNAFVSTGLAKVSLPGAMYSVENDIHRGFGTDIVSGVIYRTNDTGTPSKARQN